MSISMEQVAKLAGTSRATVSYVLRGNWRERRISESTYRRIKDIAEAHEYRPNFLAQSLVSKKTRVIGVKFPGFLYDHWSSILRQVDMEARKREHRLLLAMPASWSDEEDQIEMLFEHRVDGLILAPLRPRRLWRLYDFLDREKVPYVFLGNAPGKKYPSVVDDNVGQAAMAVRHLLDLGHERVAILVGHPQSRGAIERLNGYRQALAERGIQVRKEYIRTGSLDTDSAHEQTLKLMSLAEPPTAIYAVADIVAIGAIEAVEQTGRRVPSDVAVVGHGDDFPFKSFQRIPLTTVRQPREQLAIQSMEMLFDMMAGQTPDRTWIELPGELIIRQSCGGGRGTVET